VNIGPDDSPAEGNYPALPSFPEQEY